MTGLLWLQERRSCGQIPVSERPLIFGDCQALCKALGGCFLSDLIISLFQLCLRLVVASKKYTWSKCLLSE
jgi:hypothetical protein